MTVRDMLEAHPRSSVLDRDLLLRCIEECIDCAATCTSCADADLAEPDVAGDGPLHSTLPRLRRRLRGHRPHPHQADRARPRRPPCGDRACAVTLSGVLAEAVSEKHASQHEHCRICAEVCRRYERACRTCSQRSETKWRWARLDSRPGTSTDYESAALTS